MLKTLTICAIALIAVTGCSAKTEFFPPPPNPSQAFFDELEQGSCPQTFDWYRNDFDPWADAYCRAHSTAEECGTFGTFGEAEED